MISFLLKVFIISFSGAMQPGPVTATALVVGARNRYAGLALAAGHAIIELPLMIVITLGIGTIFKSTSMQIAIGLAGGAILLFMAVQMWVSVKRPQESQQKALNKSPILAGIILSASNPYFLIWWATIGLKLATDAKEFGLLAFPLFALVHWLCDGGWLQALSWASFKGTRLMSRQSQNTILSGCAAAMFLFGVKFILDSACSLFELTYLG